ncbi:fucolectin-4-like [Mobula birostris]|uniref:fucolectin-4-like n=1 Tax=Mobula birostris TaxID=1983395 RepID=UPI003B289007
MKTAVWIILAVCWIAGAQKCGNVALRGKATQSSTGYGGVADRAIDGNRDTNYHRCSCTHTLHQVRPWWSVDLFDEVAVFVVKITNRGDCCWDRFRNATVIIGNSQHHHCSGKVCGVISALGAGDTAVLKCNCIKGRFVTVVLGGTGILTMCEVEVYVNESG